MTLHHRADPRRNHAAKPIPMTHYVPPIEVADQFPAERFLDGEWFDVVFNGCQETQDWPLPKGASSLAGCRKWEQG